MNTCPYVCNNKTSYGYCCSTACINPLYNRITVTKWLEKADYVPVVRCKECKHFDDQELCSKHGFFVGLDLTFFCKSGERKDDE